MYLINLKTDTEKMKEQQKDYQREKAAKQKLLKVLRWWWK